MNEVTSVRDSFNPSLTHTTTGLQAATLSTIPSPTSRANRWLSVQMHGIAETLPISLPTGRHVHVTVIALEKSS